ncbi:MAG TPA: ABC transporter ATP-binding protein [Anaerolineae bacterium]|nr:ABC transporter ATP-binding protein [Anaerolineae bacterium]
MALPEERAQHKGRVMRRLASYLQPYLAQIGLVVLLVLVGTAMQVAGPYLIGVAIDDFISVGDRAGLARTMMLLLGTYVVGWATNSGQFYLMAWIGQQMLARMRNQIFERIQQLSLSFFDKHEAGDLMSRLVNDVDVINQLFSGGLVRILGDLLMLLGILAMMLHLNLRLALASFTVLPVMVIVTVLFSQRARVAFRETREKIGAVSAELQESLVGMREVQAFARERANQERFVALNAANRDANVGAVAITSAFMPAVDILSTIAMAIVAGYGGYLALHDLASVGVIVAFLTYVQRFFRPIRSISQLYTTFQAALAGGERIFGLLDTPVEVTDAPDAVEMPPIVGRVEFEHVHFGYKPGEEVLHDISLVAEPGQTVALVGPTGAGKTTIVNLLTRFYDVWSGAVRIDGYDVRQVTQASLRRQMGVVLQDTFLFTGTIADNIRYGRLDASDEEVEAAARLVNAHDFVSRLPDGYQTEVLERGANLSQGQRQLIAFARAVLADPRILILDEATSSVDTRTEMLIQQALRRLLQGRTSFVIAHRLSTIRNADQVLVIQDGRMVERGTHSQLLERRGVYYDLYMHQFKQPVQTSGDGRHLGVPLLPSEPASPRSKVK